MNLNQVAGLHSKVGSMSDCRSRINLQLGHITSMESNHKIMSNVIFPLLLIQAGQLSVTDRSMCTSSG